MSFHQQGAVPVEGLEGQGRVMRYGIHAENAVLGEDRGPRDWAPN